MVVLPAPGGATRTAFRPARRTASRSGRTSWMGNQAVAESLMPVRSNARLSHVARAAIAAYAPAIRVRRYEIHRVARPVWIALTVDRPVGPTRDYTGRAREHHPALDL